MLPAGRHTTTWGGTNDGGERVAQGVYLLHLESGGAAASRKIVLTR
jgi:hypothetical protein